MRELLENAGLFHSTDTHKDDNAPWFVSVLQAISGWIASIFVLLTLGLFFGRFFNHIPMLVALGTGLIVAAFTLLKEEGYTLFLRHVGLALSLAGQALITLALFEWWNHPSSDSLLWLGVAALELILMLRMPDDLHRVFSAGVFGLAWIFGLHTLGVGALAAPALLGGLVWLSLHEFDDPDAIFSRQAIGWGLSLVVVLSAVWGHAIYHDWLLASNAPHISLNRPWITGLLSGGVLLYLITVLTRESTQGGQLPLIVLGGAGAIALLSVVMPGLSVAITLLVLGFARGNTLLMGLGITALLGTSMHFYYALHTTLLIKSLLLIATGIVLLILYWLLLSTHQERS